MIEQTTVEKLATLSMLKLSPEELLKVGADLDIILDYVSQLSEVVVDTADESSIVPVENVLRDDVVTNEPGMYTDALLSLAPRRDSAYITVKKILP